MPRITLMEFIVPKVVALNVVLCWNLNEVEEVPANRSATSLTPLSVVPPNWGSTPASIALPLAGRLVSVVK
jgi:hypothetical protein